VRNRSNPINPDLVTKGELIHEIEELRAAQTRPVMPPHIQYGAVVRGPYNDAWTAKADRHHLQSFGSAPAEALANFDRLWNGEPAR
jgi:hypothetical protein